MSFGNASDGGIAGHLRDQVDVERVERSPQAHACGSHGGLASGMTGADDNYVELFSELHESDRPRGSCDVCLYSSNSLGNRMKGQLDSAALVEELGPWSA